MSVRESGDGDHQSHQEMVEIKTLLKVLVESQLNTQNQILDILKSTGNSGNNYQKDDHNAFRNPSSSKCPKPQARMLSPSIEFEEITRALPEDDRNVHYQQRPFEHRLGEFTGNHTTMEQNFKYSENGMSKKYVLNGYKQLYFAAYNGDWEKASKFLENNPQAIWEVVTEEDETALHIAAHRNHLVFIEQIVSRMPPVVLEYKTRYTNFTALHFAVMHGNLKAAEVMYKKNQKLTQIQDGDGLVPLEYALVCATGAQEEMVKYLYPITKDDDPSPFSGHRGASMLCDAISEGFYALQMQRQLQWFKCVESILRKKHRLKTNIDGDTAQHIFTEEHKGLVEKGEKWMKDTSGSCMVVAALIATVTFQAAFTVPGGYISDINSSKNGTPVFLETTSFTVFVVADALALFSSVTSVLMFFATYTSRYAEEDFYKFLPRKLIIGLGTLFISMATILVAFSASLVMLLGGRFAWALIPISLFSCVPVFLFALLQLPLFVEIVRSAYWGSLFSKHRYIHRRGNQCNANRKGK
ncbi:protein ACCELERATED CELL DEATH 6-like isoform X2 [Papaver somniferum]|uniref:protein ACCELERATED CELL DEATH 6-like isoform X2 n=1 Tax=Papaver somniferum TaxID=3469 RepID=UPI000E6FC27B|nr:protein ACCELERATED CELL DEATH 6-like isoform X2 [Papaver somniferum]